MGSSGKRKESQPSSSTGKKQRTSTPQQFQGWGHGYQSQGQVRPTSQAGPMTCYYCYQPGHMKRDYPQRQGSQGYGTTQSQSSVGHARTQFVPSYLSAGQRNQYQFQGAAQAPSTSQTGQRGQSMGRGRG